MLPVHSQEVFDAALAELHRFGQATRAAGRFIALYLGIRRMGTGLAPLGPDDVATNAATIEHFLDDMYTKTFRPPPFVVLTAPFGQSYSPNAPYSTRTGELAPGHNYPTNTWRNNFAIEKGIGCPAEPGVIEQLLDDPQLRLGCPHMHTRADGTNVCSLHDTAYRGEDHSVWLRMVEVGYQKVDLDHPGVYRGYLTPRDRKIPIFALMAVLYSFAPDGIFPLREIVGIPEFTADFGFNIEGVEEIFDCDPESVANTIVLAAAKQGVWTTVTTPVIPQAQGAAPAPLPAEATVGELNTGVGAEIAVGSELIDGGWEVEYFGNQRGIGYDLRATRGEETVHVEVKSSVAYCTPELTEEEWRAANHHGPEYVVAVVDFFGTENQRIKYLRDPVSNVVAESIERTTYRLPRQGVSELAVESEFL